MMHQTPGCIVDLTKVNFDKGTFTELSMKHSLLATLAKQPAQSSRQELTSKSEISGLYQQGLYKEGWGNR